MKSVESHQQRIANPLNLIADAQAFLSRQGSITSFFVIGPVRLPSGMVSSPLN